MSQRPASSISMKQKENNDLRILQAVREERCYYMWKISKQVTKRTVNGERWQQKCEAAGEAAAD